MGRRSAVVVVAAEDVTGVIGGAAGRRPAVCAVGAVVRGDGRPSMAGSWRRPVQRVRSRRRWWPSALVLRLAMLASRQERDLVPPDR